MTSERRQFVIGQSVPRLEDPPLVTGRGRFAGDIVVSASAAHARRALAHRAWPRSRAIDVAAARAAPGRRRGVDRGRHRRPAADRFPRRADRAACALPPAACWRATGCAMSASRSPRCSPTIPISPRTRPISSRSTIEELPPLLDAAAAPGEFAPASAPRPTVDARRLWRRRRGVCRARMRSSSSISRSAAIQRRAAGDARRDRALRRGARRAGAVRRRQGAASQPRRARPHARAQRRRDAC